MAVLNYKDFFDFDSYNAAIKEAEQTNIQFGKAVGTVLQQLQQNYNNTLSEVRDYVKVLEMFNVNNRDATETLKKLGNESQAVASKAKEQQSAMQGLTNVVDLQTVALNELKAAQKEITNNYSQLGGASADIKSKEQALAQEFQRVTEAIKQKNAVLKGTIPIIQDSSNTYTQWNNELKALTKQLISMPNAFDAVTGKINTNNAEAVALQKQIGELDSRLKMADSTMGKFGRNVGNYKSGFQGLSSAFTQITREAPAFAMNMQTGLMAISNNLPIFFDQIKMTNDQLKALKASGEKVPSMFQALATSMFSWQTALSLGITLLTVYGKEIGEFISKAFKGSSALDTMKESQTQLNEAISNGQKNAVEETLNLKSLLAIAKDTSLSYKERKIAVDELQSTYPAYFGNLTQEQILAGKTTESENALTEAILSRAKANAAVAKITENQALVIDNEMKALELKKQLRIVNDGILSTEKKLQNSDNVSNSQGIALSQMYEKHAKLIKQLNELSKEKNDLDAINNSLTSFALENQKKAILLDDKEAKKNLHEEDKKRKAAEDKKNLHEELLKKEYESQVKAQEQLLAERRINEVGFLITKYNLTEKYVKDAIDLENSYGKKANQSKIQEYKNLLQDVKNEKIKAELKATDEERKESKQQLQKQIENETELKIKALEGEKKLIVNNKDTIDYIRHQKEVEYQNSIDELTIDSLKRRANLEEDATKKSELLQKATLLRQTINDRNTFYQKVTNSKDSTALALKYLNDEYNLKKAKGQSSLIDEIVLTKKIIEVKKIANEDTKQDELRLHELKMKYLDEYFNKLNNSWRNVSSIIGNEVSNSFITLNTLFEDLAKGIKEPKKLIEDIGNSLIAISGAVTSELKSASERRIKTLEDEKERDLKAAGNNTAAKEKIEKEYQKRIAAEKVKQARAEKAMALFNIAINTAMGVSSVLSTGGGTRYADFGISASILSAFVIATGLAQAALVLAKPIPKYKTGRKGGKEEIAVVDEIGGELIIDRFGRLKQVGTDKGARLTRLDSGDSVIPAHQTKNYLLNNYGIEYDNLKRKESNSLYKIQWHKERLDKQNNYNQSMNENSLKYAFKEAIKEIPIHQTIHDEYGIRRREKRANETLEYLNNLNRI